MNIDKVIEIATAVWKKASPYKVQIGYFFLVTALLISFKQCDSERDKWKAMEEDNKRREAAGKAEAGKQDVKDREDKVYPDIDKQIEYNNKVRKDIKKEKDAVKLPSRKDIDNDVQKGNIDSLVAKLRAAGYAAESAER